MFLLTLKLENRGYFWYKTTLKSVDKNCVFLNKVKGRIDKTKLTTSNYLQSQPEILFVETCIKIEF